jgi:hypothetical protein
MRIGSRSFLPLAILVGACHAGGTTPASSPAPASRSFLYAWAADSDKKESDLLAVIDADPRSSDYTRVVATLPVGATATMAHHTEAELASDRILWASGFAVGKTYRFDLNDPRAPKLVGEIADVPPYSHPHSYVRLAGGGVLATFQYKGGDDHATGGLVEFDRSGKVVRTVSAATPADSTVRPYSLAPVPALDRLVTTATDMHGMVTTSAVQIWRLSDLTLLQTIQLPRGPRGYEHLLTAEPRLLADGRTVLVSTFQCGLYRLTGLDGNDVRAEWLGTTEWAPHKYCAVPLLAGKYWMVPSGAEHAVIVFDISGDKPHEVARLTLAEDEVPHWLALDPTGTRVVITGYAALSTRVLIARFDPASGGLALDPTFTTAGAPRPGVDLAKQGWAGGAAIPHGTVFSR